MEEGEVEEEEGYKERMEIVKKRNGESNQHISETAKREASNRNNESEPRNPSHSFSRRYSGRFISHQG